MGKAIRRTRLSLAVAAAAALVASAFVPTAQDAAHADPPPPPTSIVLGADALTFVAGEVVELTATTDQTVTDTGEVIRIFDDTTSTEIKSCATGDECSVDVQFFSGPAHTYVATVASLESDPIEIARTPWAVDLAADLSVLLAGETAELTATANQDVGATNSEYELFVFNMTTDELVSSCVTGLTCVGDTEPFYVDASLSSAFIAIVGGAGSPTTIDEVDDVQAMSDPITIERAQWELGLQTDVATVSAGDVVELTLTSDQDVSLTNGAYALYIVNVITGEILVTCTTGTTCEATDDWTGAGWGLFYVGFVAAADSPVDYSEMTDILMGAGAPVSVDGWDVTISGDKEVLSAGEDVTVTATTDQDLGDTSGELVLYVLDWAQGVIVETCTTGTSCIKTDRFYKDADVPYLSRVYAAVVSEPGFTDPNEIGNYYGYASGVRVDILPWITELDLTGGAGPNYQFTAEFNQDLGQTNDQLAFYLFNAETFELEDSCIAGARCLLQTQSDSAIGYIGLIADRTDPPTMDDAENVRGGATVSWSSMVNGFPVFGPVIGLEGIGGKNPAEKPCQCAHADPINTATGEYFENLNDIEIPGAGPALAINRSYSTSKASVIGPLGFGWSADFDARITELIPGDLTNPLPVQVEVVQENGSTVRFTRDGATDAYTTLERVQATLEFNDGTDTWAYVRDLTETLTFDDAGRLISTSDLNGNEVSITRDSSGNVGTLTASGGRFLELTWTGDQVTAVEDSAGRIVSYGYDGIGNLATVTAVDGAVTTYSYDAEHRVVTVTKPGGGVTTNAYDYYGRVSAQIDPVGRETTFAYLDDSLSSSVETTITAPDGSQIVEEYINGVLISQTRAAGTAYEATTSYAYDAALNLLAMSDAAGAVTTYTYNGDGRVITQTDALDRTTIWTYDAFGSATSVIDPLTRETTYAYDGNGNLLTTEHPGGGIEEWTYNTDGTIASYEDARGKLTEYSYTSQGWVSSVEDPVGAVTTSTYSSAGFVVGTMNALLQSSEMTRDAHGRVLTSTDPLDRTTTVTYDVDGNVTSVTDPEGDVTLSAFDAAGQQTSATDATGNVIGYTYAPGGQLASTTQPGSITSTNEYNALGQLVSTTDPLGRVITFDYDIAGHLSATTWPSGSVATDAYDLVGQLISRTDAAGEITLYEYDDAGQMTSSTDPLNRETETAYTPDGWVDTVTLPDSSQVQYEYDATGSVTEVTDADGYVTNYTYDDAGRLVETERPGGSVTALAYDLLGQLTVKTLPDGTSLEHGYDDSGQLVEIDPSVSGATSISYSYDDAGRRVGMGDATGSSTASYDAAGRLTSETDGNGNSVGYAYDALGRVSELTYPSSGSVTYGYNAAGEMTSLTDWNSNTVSFAWTLDGELATRTDPNGVVMTRGYTERGELAEISVDTSVANLLGIDYGYDEAGQLVSREFAGESYPDSAAEYEYDSLGQLASTDYAGDFESSSGGQLVHLANGSSLSYDSEQQLEDVTPSSGPVTDYTYNDNGARVSAAVGSSSTNYDYNAQGALVAVDDGTSTIEYEADGTSLRRTRTDGTTSSEFTWATNGSIPLLLSDSDYSYIYGVGSTPVAQVTGSGEIEYLFPDMVGSTVFIANEDATETGHYEYAEYGAVLATGGTLGTAMQYTGNWADPTTGLLYLRARDYDPFAGQFFSIDPLVDETQQPYAYAANNPLQFNDPTGLRYCPASGGPCFEDPVYRDHSTYDQYLKGQEIRCDQAAVAANLDRHLSTLPDWLEPGARFYLGPGADLAQATAPLLGALAGGQSIGVARTSTSLYRFVGPAEFGQLNSTRRFSQGPNSLEGKWFAESASDARRWGQAMDGGNGRVIGVSVTNTFAQTMHAVDALDGIGPARYAADLAALNRSTITMWKAH